MRYHVRRKDKEITDEAAMKRILKTTQYVTIAMARDNRPYLVSLSHGYDEEKHCVYFHCAREGKKLDYLKGNSSVWGQAVIDGEYVHGECSHNYASVMFSGDVTFLEGAFLSGLLGVAIPIVVHLLHRKRRRRVTFPSLRFLREVQVRTARRSRIQEWLLLVLRVATIAVLALALARPVLRSSALGPGRVTREFFAQAAAGGYHHGFHSMRSKKKTLRGVL